MHQIRSTVIRGERRDPIAAKRGGRDNGSNGSLSAIRIRREESRRCDQRREGRQLDVVDRAELSWHRRKLDVSVLNVSSRGAMIETDLMPRIGARLHLRFADCNSTRCFVRWVRDGRIGVEFEKETLVIAPRDLRERVIGGRRAGERPTVSLGKARAPRQSLILTGQLHWRGGTTAVRLRNISAEGAMLDAGEDLDANVEVVLELPGVVAATGKVRWCRSGQIGIRFDRPLDLAGLTLGHQPHERQSPHMLKPDYLKTELEPHSPWAARWQRLMAEDL